MIIGWCPGSYSSILFTILNRNEIPRLEISLIKWSKCCKVCQVCQCVRIICLFESYRGISQLAKGLISSHHAQASPRVCVEYILPRDCDIVVMSVRQKMRLLTSCVQEQSGEVWARQPAGDQPGRERGQRRVLLPGQRLPHPGADTPRHCQRYDVTQTVGRNNQFGFEL